MDVLQYNQISLNEPVLWLEQKWGRKLTDHEKNIVGMVYSWTRTSQEAEEIKILEHRMDVCYLCQDVPSKVDLKGQLFCNSCFEEIYL